VTRSLERAEALRRREIPVRIISEEEFLTLLWGERGGDGPVPEGPKSYPLGEVASLVGVEPEMIERWEHLGLVRSSEGLYDFRDIVSLQSIASLVRSGASPDAIRRALQAISSVLPDVDRPLAQLKIVVAASGELLAQIGESLIDPQGQQRLDFEGVAELSEVKPAQLAQQPTPMPDSPDECFERALILEEEERHEEAAALYRWAIALAPGWAEAHFNLANVLRMLERDEGAEEVYLLSVALDPSNELAWYNLADAQEEDGRLDAAVASLRAAIGACPTFADAHFNLASCLEQLGDRVGAKAHWGAYLRLDPDSEWATIARDHLRR
jgi:tetratricopeptide (TPR) repeat protein